MEVCVLIPTGAIITCTIILQVPLQKAHISIRWETDAQYVDYIMIKLFLGIKL